ncbi:MAG: cyclase family protein, partial [Bacilli bacterium]|nr:cyclase family protein [Bacilli bacterium]
MKDFLWIDLSHSIGSDTVVYPGDPRLQIEFKRQVERDGYSLSSVCTGMHVGTHVDSPLHFVSKGENIGDLPIERWMGWATKIKIESNSNLVTTASLKNAWDKSDCHHDILLIDTGHSS